MCDPVQLLTSPSLSLSLSQSVYYADLYRHYRKRREELEAQVLCGCMRWYIKNNPSPQQNGLLSLVHVWPWKPQLRSLFLSLHFDFWLLSSLFCTLVHKKGLAERMGSFKYSTLEDSTLTPPSLDFNKLTWGMTFATVYEGNPCTQTQGETSTFPWENLSRTFTIFLLDLLLEQVFVRQRDLWHLLLWLHPKYIFRGPLEKPNYVFIISINMFMESIAYLTFLWFSCFGDAFLWWGQAGKKWMFTL